MYKREWKNYLESELRYSPLTVRAYTDDLAAFKFYLKETDPSQATFSDLRSYIMSLVERGDNPRSTNRHRSSLKSYFKYLTRSGIITINPTLKLRALPIQHKLPEFISRPKGEKLFSELTTTHEENDPEDERNDMIVLLLYTTGIRRAELASLTTDSIDLEQKKIRVIGKGSKEREIPLLNEVCKLLERYLQNICKNEKKHLFLTKQNKPITHNQIYEVVKKVLTRAGIQGKQTPHTLRHTFATHLMAGGASIKSIQELLGHSSLSSTEIYTHNTIETLKESYNRAHPRAKKL